MRKTITITGIAAVLALSGCAVPVDDVETGSQAAAPIETPAPVEQDVYEDVAAAPEGDESGYIADLDEFVPEWRNYGTRADAIELGWITCSVFDDMGVEAGTAIVAESSVGNVPVEVAAATTVAAVIYLCPVHAPALEAYLTDEDTATY
jgi:hypothetical protein